MPSTNQPAQTHERREKHIDGIDEDPARWLDREIVTRQDRKAMLDGLIAGMDRIERVRAWKAVERWLGEKAEPPREACPRDWIIAQLDAREATLERIGERPDRLPHGPWPACDCCDGEGLTAADARARREEEREQRVAGYRTEGVDTSETTPETEGATLGQFATDGGQDSE